jgi:ribosomal protein L37AE/L43A
MAKFRKKSVIVDAVQLRWDTWKEMCEHAGVGKLEDGKPEGCYVDAYGNLTEDSNGRIGLKIPTLQGVTIGVEGEWIVRGSDGALWPVGPNSFIATYESFEPGSGEPSIVEIGHKNGQVVMNCGGCEGVPPHWTAWSTKQARVIARKIESTADAVDGEYSLKSMCPECGSSEQKTSAPPICANCGYRWPGTAFSPPTDEGK